MLSAPDESAVRYLLRNLHRGEKLRASRLVRRYVAARALRADQMTGDQLRRSLCSFMRHALEAPDGLSSSASRLRQSEIFCRVDLDGASPQAVYTDLGLSRRQYFRERGELLRTLSIAFENLIFESEAAVVMPTALEILRARATVLDAAGEQQNALASLRNIMEGSFDLADRLEAALDAVHLALSAVDLRSAQEAFSRAAQIRGLCQPIGRDQEAILGAEMRLAAAAVSCMSGDFLSAEAEAVAVSVALRPLAGANRRAHHALVRALALLAITSAWHASGDTAVTRARQALHQSSARIDTDPLLHAETLEGLCWALRLTPGGFRDALPLTQQLMAYARQFSLPRMLLASGIIQCDLLRMQGRQHQATARAEQCLSVVPVTRPDYMNLINKTLARAFIEIGETGRALDVVRSSLDAGLPESERLVWRLIEMEADLRDCRWGATLEHASQTLEAFRRGGNVSFVGVTLRIIAAAEHGRNKATAARESIRESLQILESTPLASELARAYRVSYAVTGNRDHLAHSRDIAAVYRSDSDDAEPNDR